MAHLKIKYIAIGPYYSDQVQTFIGFDIDDCWNQEVDFEKYLGREHPHGINTIYKIKIIEEKF